MLLCQRPVQRPQAKISLNLKGFTETTLKLVNVLNESIEELAEGSSVEFVLNNDTSSSSCITSSFPDGDIQMDPVKHTLIKDILYGITQALNNKLMISCLTSIDLDFLGLGCKAVSSAALETNFLAYSRSEFCTMAAFGESFALSLKCYFDEFTGSSLRSLRLNNIRRLPCSIISALLCTMRSNSNICKSLERLSLDNLETDTDNPEWLSELALIALLSFPKLKSLTFGRVVFPVESVMALTRACDVFKALGSASTGFLGLECLELLSFCVRENTQEALVEFVRSIVGLPSIKVLCLQGTDFKAPLYLALASVVHEWVTTHCVRRQRVRSWNQGLDRDIILLGSYFDGLKFNIGRFVRASHHQITDSEVEILSCLIPSCDGLLELNLDDNALSSASMRSITHPAINCLYNIRTLILSHNCFDDADAELLVEALLKFKNIKVLDISYNPAITNCGAKNLIRLLPVINVLNINGNVHITDLILNEIYTRLVSHSGYVELHLTGTQVSKSGIKMIKEQLVQEQSALKKLFLIIFPLC